MVEGGCSKLSRDERRLRPLPPISLLLLTPPADAFDDRPASQSVSQCRRCGGSLIPPHPCTSPRRVAVVERRIANEKLFILQTENARVLQAWWRHMLMVAHGKIMLRRKRQQLTASIKIQAVYRSYRSRRLQREMHERALANWAVVITGTYDMLRHMAANKIINWWRPRIRMLKSDRNATQIQRIFRGHLGRIRFAMELYNHFMSAASKIQEQWRVHRARQLRLWMASMRDHSAAQIQRCFRAYKLRAFLWESRRFNQERLANESALAKQAAAADKDSERLLRALRSGEERAARTIQRAYRHHAAMVRGHTQKTLELERRLRAASEEEARVAAMQARQKAAKSGKGRMKSFLRSWGKAGAAKSHNIKSVKEKTAELRKKAGEGDVKETGVRGILGRKNDKEAQEQELMHENAVMNKHTRTSMPNKLEQREAVF